jgi:hypothetical protein
MLGYAIGCPSYCGQTSRVEFYLDHGVWALLIIFFSRHYIESINVCKQMSIEDLNHCY